MRSSVRLSAFCIGVAVLLCWSCASEKAQTGGVNTLTPPPVSQDEEQTVRVEGKAIVEEGGISRAREAALKDAMRLAVEKIVGTLIDSETLTNNYVTIRDRIYSASGGYVSRYDIIKEGLNPSDGSYQVVIDAWVRRGKVRDDLTQARIFQMKTGRKRVMVAGSLDQASGIDKTEAQSYVDSAISGANDALQEREFRVFEKEAVQRIYERIGSVVSTGDPDPSVLKAAREEGAEVYIALSVAPGKRKAGGPGRFSMGDATVRLKAYDSTTGRLLGTGKGEASERTKTAPTPHDWIRAVGNAAELAARQAVVDAAPKIFGTAASDSDIGIPFQIVLSGFTDGEVDSVIELLESDPDFKALREIGRRPGYAEVELFYGSNETGKLGKRIRTEMDKMGVKIITKDQSGSRIVYQKE